MPDSLLSNQFDETVDVSRHGLRRQADFIHEKIFRRPISEDIRAAFVSANEKLLKDARGLAAVNIDLILQRSMDVEAIEFALRRRNPQNILTKKVLILCYLTESRSAYYADFVNEQHRPIGAFISLSLETCRSVYKLLKGLWLIRMYDVV
jgi:hypothetical protein